MTEDIGQDKLAAVQKYSNTFLLVAGTAAVTYEIPLGSSLSVSDGMPSIEMQLLLHMF